MKIKEIFILATLLLSVILIVGVVPANAEIIPVIEIENDTDIFTPSEIANDSYYIIGSNDHERPYNVYYRGNIRTFGNYAYGTSWAYASNSWSLYPDNLLSTTLKTSSRRNRFNPFLNPLGDPLPKLVEFNNPNGTFTAMQQRPFSLHFNHSYTFLAESGMTYTGLLQSSEPLYLDVEIWEAEFEFFASDIYGIIHFGNADPREVQLLSGKNTIPVFPRETTLNFTFWLGSFGKTPTSLVTFTPHVFQSFNVMNGYQYVDFEAINKTNIPVNSTYFGTVDQGNFENVTAEGNIDSPADSIFSVRYFTLPIVQDNEYRVFVDNQLLDMTLGSVSAGNFFAFLIHGDMADPYYEELFPGSLTSGGLRIRALQTTDLVLGFYLQGIVRSEYAIFFNQVSPTPENIEPLTLNNPVRLLENVLYEFTLAQPVMMAINYSAVDQDIEFYKLSDGEWDYVTFTSSVGTNFLDHIPGDVYTNITGSLDERWYYIPTGTYAALPTESPGIDDLLQFNTITVQELSSGSTTLSVSENSFLALQLPITYHRYNNFSLSTTDHVNQSVWYDSFIKGKYDEIIGTTSTSTAQMGNQQNSGIWQAWAINDTQIYNILPARTNEVPILVLRPVRATQNVSDPTDLVDTFTASLTITNTVPANYYPYASVNGFNTYGLNGGAFIPLSTPVTSTSQFAINDDYSTLFNHLYSIPLTVDPDSVYNVTVYLIGNYTNGGAKNATFDGFTVTSGNMASLEVFNSEAEYENDTHIWRTLWMLTLSGSDHYLYVDIVRDFFPVLNATMIITLTKMPITKMSFNIPETYTWSATLHSNEISDNSMLLLEIPAEYVVFPAPGFEVLFVLGGLVITAAIILKYRQKKRAPKYSKRSG
ncbi:MAG: hypothetical protein ACFFCZ_04500 [Promethearchaeota archaeon]